MTTLKQPSPENQKPVTEWTRQYTSGEAKDFSTLRFNVYRVIGLAEGYTDNPEFAV
jgi:hypothetical protein